MKRILRFLIRGGLFLVLLLLIDQAILHMTLDVPGIREVRHFYVDFRDRLLHLGDEDSPTIEAAIETAEETTGENSTKASSTPPPESSPRYLYADEDGQLQFADSLEQIPPAYRQSAQLLDE